MNRQESRDLARALVATPDVFDKERVCAFLARNIPMIDAGTFKRECGFPNLSAARMDELLKT